MFFPRRTPVVRVLVPLAGGSLAGYLSDASLGPGTLIIPGTVLCLVLGSMLAFSGRRRVVRDFLFNLVVFALHFWTGFGTGIIDRPKDPGLPAGERILVGGTIRESPSLQNGKWVFEMDLRMAATADTACLIRTVLKVYLPVPSDSLLPVPGEFWKLSGRLYPIRNAGNPGEINYSEMMARKNCWYRFYGDSLSGMGAHMVAWDQGGFSAERIRNAVARKWKGNPDAISLLKAVCLGDRTQLSDGLRESYALAGGMHVLAVSGLHVGLIWWLLQGAFSFLVRLSGREIYRAALIISLLWFYAMVTGFSSPVCRSVTMFTLFSATRLLNQRPNPVNAILVSAFFLILVHPGRMLEAGFQLSYAAIMAIVTLHPLLRKLVRAKNRIIKWGWEATAVSVAAQAGTLPLVVFYFHQVPVYALLTNLVAIPLLSCIIVLFLLSVPLLSWGAGAGIAGRLLGILGETMNLAMEGIASLPGAVIGNLYLDRWGVGLSVAAIFLGIAWLRSGARIPVYLLILCLCLGLCRSAATRYTRVSSSQVAISHLYEGSLVTFREGNLVDHYIWCSDPGSVDYIDRVIAGGWGNRCFESSVIWINRPSAGTDHHCLPDPRIECGGISACGSLCPGIWLLGNGRNRGLVVTGIPGRGQARVLGDLDPDFLLLSGEPAISASQMDSMCSPSCEVIADGSNRSWYTGRLKDRQLKIHLTGERGAYLKQW
jgi:competence protein ComEC